MNTQYTDLWSNGGNKVIQLPPSPDDIFVVTLLFGKVMFCQPIAEYQKAVRVAEGFIRRVRPPRPITLKVLSVTGAEASTMMQIDPATLFADQTPEEEAQLRGLVVARCKDALRDNNDPAVRNDAYDLLINLGELK